MKLSIVIVNYNVRHFLNQCLQSVHIALKGIDTEVYVIDNNSVDGSASMVKEQFPWAHLIVNDENLGFSKANNIGISSSTGDYVLLLNPDTVVEEDTFSKILEFMDSHPEAGGLGVKMVDGKGRFLPESKRGLPTPAAAFWKISGLARLFPKSATFGRYHLGFLDNDKTHDIDILSGAFMLLRREALDKAGILDETFFMYGEDIDLSYRIQKAGYRNYYYPETRIIHYKGESTKKGSLNYVRMFYQAMVVFAKKHFTGERALLLSFLINLAIFIRATAALINRGVKAIAIPLIDALVMFGGLYFIKGFWERYVKYGDTGYYPPEFLLIEVPAFIVVWLLSLYLSGAYDKPVRLQKVFRGIVFGTVAILIIYALLPENLRFSRALILLGFAWGMLSLPLIRILFNAMRIKGFQLEKDKNRRFAIVGELAEVNRVASLLMQSTGKLGFIAKVKPSEGSLEPEYVGNLRQLEEIVRLYAIDEVVFCSRDLGATKIIDVMSGLQHSNVELKIAPPFGDALIGSNSIHTSGDIYLIDVDAISSKANRRTKRLFDFIVSLGILVTFPIWLVLARSPINALKNAFMVMTGKYTWVGYSYRSENLPKIRPGVFTPAHRTSSVINDNTTTQRLDMLYARDYQVQNDITIVVKNIRDIGRSAES